MANFAGEGDAGRGAVTAGLSHKRILRELSGRDKEDFIGSVFGRHVASVQRRRRGRVGPATEAPPLDVRAGREEDASGRCKVRNF